MRQLLFLLFLFSWFPTFAQTNTFTGLIVYQYEFHNPATGEDVTELMAPYLGNEQHYYINGSSYKSYDENGNLGQLYNSQTNTYYFVKPTTGQIMKRDADTNTSEVLVIHHLDETETILGRLCKKLVVQTESSETTYWYSPQITVNPKIYANHEFGGWGRYMEASEGALPLKYVVKRQNYTLTSTASKIIQMDFVEDDFNLEKIMSKN